MFDIPASFWTGSYVASSKLLSLIQFHYEKLISFILLSCISFSNTISILKSLKQSLPIKTTLTALFCWKKRVLPFIVQKNQETPKIIQINFLIKNCLNSKFYWPNVFHYGFKKLNHYLELQTVDLTIYSHLAHVKNIDELGF